MKIQFLLSLTILTCQITLAQVISVSADKMNIFYVGMDNPVTIAVENCQNKFLVVKATNGNITEANGQYIFRSNKVGHTEITIYNKSNSKLVKLGSSMFRVKSFPLPVFKIGAGRHSITKAQLTDQEFVRAELEDSDFDAKFPIDSFSVCIVPSDTCSYTTMKNIGGKLNDDIRNVFRRLKENDAVIFKNIYTKDAGGEPINLVPVMITVHK